jgi:hypothetical protein
MERKFWSSISTRIEISFLLVFTSATWDMGCQNVMLQQASSQNNAQIQILADDPEAAKKTNQLGRPSNSHRINTSKVVCAY